MYVFHVDLKAIEDLSVALGIAGPSSGEYIEITIPHMIVLRYA